jgi:uncharacterized protein (DUF305 family)
MKHILLILFVAAAFACGGHSEHDGHGHSGHDHTGHDHSTMDHSSHDHSAMESSPGAADAPADLQFIDTMIAHHQRAVDMARLAESRAEREEIKKFGAAIIADQEREITQMRRWRDEWFKDAIPAVNMDYPGMREGMAGMDMNRLESLSGKAFDVEFIRQMIPHHDGALIMSEAVLGKGDAKFKSDRVELLKLGEAIIKAQKEEIEQMKKWLGEWEAEAK